MKKIFLNSLAAAVLIGIGFNSTVAVAGDCKAVKFKRGAYSTTLKDSIGANETDCFTVATGANQTMKVNLYDQQGNAVKENVVASIEGEGDARDQFNFKTKKQTYQINVFQLEELITVSKYKLVINVR